ncbi:sodium hydrogen exchanger family protein, putative, partial [Ichthyophthirius multifiliis]
ASNNICGWLQFKKTLFFQNFQYITVYGLFGTIINFLVVWGLTYLINKAGLIRNFDLENPIQYLNTKAILLFSATICATDSVSALAMISPSKYPKLFSIIFGEGMVNDSVSIILYTAVFEMVKDPKKEIEFNFLKFLEMFGQFIKNAVLSILMGLAFGLFVTYLTKKVRVFEQLPKLETAIIFSFGFLSYLLSEICQLSGVITILVCGITMSHYLMYNISEKAKTTTKVVFDTISQICEAVLYIALGVVCFQFNGNDFKQKWSWSFILLEIIVCFLSRFFSIFILSWLFIGYYQFRNKKCRINVYEISIIWFAGVIRGAIAFALILKVPLENDSDYSTYIVQSTTFAIVIITTIILGGIMPSFVHLVLKKMQVNPQFVDNNSIQESLAQGEPYQDRQYKSYSQKKWKT